MQVFVFTIWSLPFIFTSCSHWKVNIYLHSEAKQMTIIFLAESKQILLQQNVLYFPIFAKENVCSIFFQSTLRVKLIDDKQEHNLLG